MAWLEHFFQLQENQTTLRQEIVGGCTTFLTMSYIIFVNPVILSTYAGMDFGAVMTATCLTSALATFLMAFLANYPIALAPAMGHNVFFATVVCTSMGIPWQTALGAIFISGLLFVALGAFNIREIIMDSIPASLKFGIAVGIGLMISLLGFEWAGLVVHDDVTLVKVGSFAHSYVWVSGVGLCVSLILTCWRLRGAIFFGILTAAITAWWLNLISFHGFISTPPSLSPTLFAMRPLETLQAGLYSIIFTFLLLDVFDTVGTLVSVAELGGFMRNGTLPRARQAFFCDAVGTVAGAVLGTTTVTSYVESCSGISDGARTGLASVITGSLFLLALIAFPVVELLGQGIPTASGGYVYPIIAPALIMVGFMMMRGVQYIPWDDPVESIPAYFTILFIGFSFSITEGIAFGFISYVLLASVTGRIRKIHPAMLILSIVFALRFLMME